MAMRGGVRTVRTLAKLWLVLVPCFASADIQVVPVYDGQRAYLRAALAESSPDLEALARKHIVDPYLDLCSAGLSDEDRNFNQEAMGRPITAFDELSKNLQELENQNTASRLLDVLKESVDILPARGDVTVCVEARDPAKVTNRELTERLTKGVAAQYYGAGVIWVSVYPFAGWFDVARAAIPHEYHHFVRSGVERDSLLEVMVAEGLADAFSKEVFGGWTPDPEWYFAFELRGEEEARLWAEFLPNLQSGDEAVIRRYLFGSMSGAEDLPPVPGYEFGRYIVNQFLENAPEITVDRWSLMPAEDIFRVSGYAGNRNVEEGASSGGN